MVEIRTTDRTGLLAMLTNVFERSAVDIAWAKITTLGSSVVDVFGLTVPASSSVDEVRTSLERELYAVLPAVGSAQAGRTGQLACPPSGHLRHAAEPRTCIN